MKFPKTTELLNTIGQQVISTARKNLKSAKPYPKTTSRNTLYKDMNYNVSADPASGFFIEFTFGNADDYWKFVDEGVRGSGKAKGGTTKKGKKAKRGGTGTLRAKGSPFRFKNKMPPRKVIDKWVVRKPLKSARDKDGRFIPRKSMVYLIQRSIFQKGLYRTRFFSKPYDQAINDQQPMILDAYLEDMMDNLEQDLNKDKDKNKNKK